MLTTVINHPLLLMVNKIVSSLTIGTSNSYHLVMAISTRSSLLSLSEMAEVMAEAGDLVMMERSNLDNFTLGPFTINSEQYARQLVNLSESDSSNSPSNPYFSS